MSEVILTEKSRCLEESDLEIHENYFLFGSHSPQDSDSDIEVVTKPVKLYSKVLQQNLFTSGCNTSCDSVIDTQETDEDDSEIEVLGRSHHADDDSLGIVFCYNSEEEMDDYEKDMENVDGR